MKTLNIFLFIILLILGGYIGYELLKDRMESMPAETEQNQVVEPDNVEPVTQASTNPYADDITAVNLFKVLVENNDEDMFRDYVRSLAGFLPAEKATEFNAKVSVMNEEQWQDLYSSSKNFVSEVSLNTEFFFVETEIIKESDRYGVIPGVRYYEVVVEEDPEIDYKGGYVAVFVGDDSSPRYVPGSVFNRLIR